MFINLFITYFFYYDLNAITWSIYEHSGIINRNILYPLINEAQKNNNFDLPLSPSLSLPLPPSSYVYTHESCCLLLLITAVWRSERRGRGGGKGGAVMCLLNTSLLSPAQCGCVYIIQILVIFVSCRPKTPSDRES